MTAGKLVEVEHVDVCVYNFADRCFSASNRQTVTSGSPITVEGEGVEEAPRAGAVLSISNFHQSQEIHPRDSHSFLIGTPQQWHLS